MNRRRVIALGLGSLLLSASAAISSAAWADDPSPEPTATSAEAVSCDATPTAEDGSWSQTCSDGSSYTYNADGSWVQKFAGGCVISGDAEGNSTREGDCPEEAPIGTGGGCFAQTDENGDAVLGEDGKPLIACADGVACSADGPEVACPMMYATGVGSGRDDCPQCRTFKGGAEPALASGQQREPAELNSDRLASDVANLDAAKTTVDQASALESASKNQPAVALPGTGQTKGAGPLAPIAATVLGGGLVAAGVNIWRGRLKPLG